MHPGFNIRLFKRKLLLNILSGCQIQVQISPGDPFPVSTQFPAGIQLIQILKMMLIINPHETCLKVKCLYPDRLSRFLQLPELRLYRAVGPDKAIRPGCDPQTQERITFMQVLEIKPEQGAPAQFGMIPIK